jgi:flavin reductase (DIM6/NTAB) family NADH-FMN oxidoreductase RutF
MSKINWKPGTMIYPLPAVLVSCGATPEEYNLITVSWTGTICTDPPMCYISLRPTRHSYEIIKRTGEYVINLTTEKLARATDWCGVKSGKDFNKWKETGLTPAPATIVKAPVVAEAPVSIECKVKEVLNLGSHHMFISEVVNVIADDQYMDPVTRAFSLKKAGPLCYVHGHYFKTGDPVGKFGWSVEKKAKGKKLRAYRTPEKGDRSE